MMNLTPPQDPIFDYRSLRLAMGAIALFLPLVVTLISDVQLESISASYHTEARDIFVGLLFVVAAFLLAYNGWTVYQAIVSKFAAIGAILVAIFPTITKGSASTAESYVHDFGVAWNVAGKYFSVLVNPEEQLNMFVNKG